jgi:ABC-2 type transport system permease protein
VLADLSGPIDVVVLVPSTIGEGRPNPVLGEVREVLSRMSAVSPALRVRLVDPDRARQEAEQLIADYGLGGRELADGVLLVRAGQGADLRRAHLLPSDLVTYATGPEVQATGPRVKAFRGEEALLTKFLEVSEPRKLRVCYTQGHGEPEYDNLEPYAGYAHLRDLLRDANLETRIADLDAPEGLAECDVLLIGGPQGRFPPAHVRAVERFRDGGGDILVLAGAVILRGKTGLAHHGLEDLLREHGISFGERVVLDPHTMPGASPLLAFTINEGWGEHEAVHSLAMRPVSFVQVRELRLEAPAEPLISVAEDAWAEADVDGFQSGAVPEFDDAVDRRGPIPIAAASEKDGSRIVVIASDQFALNALLREDVAFDHGRDLILNAVGWLGQREALLGIRPREREHVKLVLQPRQLRRMTLVCLVGLPAFAIGLGLIVLWRRRR